MVYSAKILSIVYIDDIDGAIELEIEGTRIYSIYWADSNFAEKYLVQGSTIPVELWMVDHSIPEIFTQVKPVCIPYVPPLHGNILYGRVTKILGSHSYRLDCGDFFVNIHEDNEFHPEVGSYMRISGCFQAFLADTEYSWENIGCGF